MTRKRFNGTSSSIDDERMNAQAPQFGQRRRLRVKAG
jgi:hypothetical protein